MKSEIKIGQRMSASWTRADKELRQIYCVRVLSDRKKDSIRRSTITWPIGLRREHSERPKTLNLVLANDGSVYRMASGLT